MLGFKPMHGCLPDPMLTILSTTHLVGWERWGHKVEGSRACEGMKVGVFESRIEKGLEQETGRMKQGGRGRGNRGDGVGGGRGRGGRQKTMWQECEGQRQRQGQGEKVRRGAEVLASWWALCKQVNTSDLSLKFLCRLAMIEGIVGTSAAAATLGRS
ncbi:hypothetical protein E2C01_059760 [Portunus trituberculatus]|uniref:Uncharacterized protein n=1 Tax=Portunus trituberculatus TaxID=210409 RepID=A0A5B7H3H4_PORTR|nr:hypothetical protein [Portunus trituberculatus]